MAIAILTAETEGASERARAAGDALWLPAAELERAVGWEYKPDEGMCREELCVPVYGEIAAQLLEERDGEEWVDFAAFARYFGLPYASNADGSAWYFGHKAEEQNAPLTMLDAPDFELADLEGRLHRRSDHRGKKVLLAAWASW